jgi:hypothetical protein
MVNDNTFWNDILLHPGTKFVTSDTKDGGDCSVRKDRFAIQI